MTRPFFVCPKIYVGLLKQLKSKTEKSFLNKTEKRDFNLKVYTKSRSTILHPLCIGNTFMVHNGKTFLKVFVSENIIGHKLGEFSSTRARYFFKKKKVKLKK